MDIDPAAILDFDGDSMGAHRQDKIHFRLRPSGGEMSHIKCWDRGKEVSQGAFGQMPSQIRELGVCRQTLGVQRDQFLEPTCPESMVAQADFWRRFFSLEPKFQGRDEANEQGSIQETEIAEDAVPT